MKFAVLALLGLVAVQAIKVDLPTDDEDRLLVEDNEDQLLLEEDNEEFTETNDM